MARKLVAGLPFNEQGAVLLDANIKHEGLVFTPIGGKEEEQDQGDPIKTLKRENWEEYRLIVEPVEFLGTYPTHSKGEGAFDVMMYHCKIVDASGAEWRDGKPVPQEPKKSAGADWFTLNDLNCLQQRGLLAGNMADLVNIHQDNFRVFQLGDIRAELPQNLTLLDLRAFIRREMDRWIEQLDPSSSASERRYPRLSTVVKLARSHTRFALPSSFLLANETIDTARSFFELCRAMASAKE